MSSSPIHIREALPRDEPALVAMGERAGMGTLFGFGSTLVACQEDGTPVGFCRIRTFDGIPYVNPIVTDERARGMGVGAALMKRANERFGELRFVARGYAIPFYRSLGCKEIPWQLLCPEVAGDCDTCGDFECCKPLPMMMPPSAACAQKDPA